MSVIRPVGLIEVSIVLLIEEYLVFFPFPVDVCFPDFFLAT